MVSLNLILIITLALLHLIKVLHLNLAQNRMLEQLLQNKIIKQVLALLVLQLLKIITAQQVHQSKLHQRQMIKIIKENQVLLVLINKVKTHLKLVLLVKTIKQVKTVLVLL